jgi:hypothetical protein
VRKLPSTAAGVRPTDAVRIFLSTITVDKAEAGASTPMLMALSGHTVGAQPGQVHQVSAEALGRWQASTDAAIAASRPVKGLLSEQPLV